VLRFPFILAGAAVCLTSGIGLADTPDPAAAETLFRAGREHAQAGDWANACPMFVESNRLDFALGTLMNLAACEEHVGRLATAWERYRELLDSLSPSDDRRAFVAASVVRLERLVPRLTVFLAVPAAEGTIVTRDDVDLGGGSIGADLPVDPGEHAIVVVAPGRTARRYAIKLAAGQRLTLHAEAGEPIGQNAEGGPPIAQNAARTGRGGRRTAAWILGGAGVGALSVGVFLGVRALSERSASDALCTKGVCRDQAALDEYGAAKSTALGADIALAVGAVSLGVAGYFLATSTTTAHPQSAVASMCVTSSGVGFAW
jgi:hypothetical protein